MNGLNQNDRYEDVKAYTTQAKLAQQAGTPHLVPWPPRDERLALRCMDAYYTEQIAFYSGWCKQTTLKHIDLPGHLFQTWKSMPGRLGMYNHRKEIKAKFEKENPVQVVGLSAMTNPFAEASAVTAERQRTEAAEALAMASAAVSSGNPELDQARQDHPDMPTTFVDGRTALPPLAQQQGSGQQNVPPSAQQKRPSTVLILDDESAKKPKFHVPTVGFDGKAMPPAPAANTSDDELSPAEMKRMLLELMKDKRKLQAELLKTVPIKKEPIS